MYPSGIKGSTNMKMKTMISEAIRDQTQEVSVIIPFYNIREYIKDCLEGVLGQTYKNLDIILVDDGSTDGGGEVLDAFSKNDERIRVIHQSNQGLSAARNAGLSIARGGFVYFVDGDDMIHSQAIEILMSIIIETNADLVQCGTFAFLDDRNIPLDDCNKVNYMTLTGRDMCKALAFGGFNNSCGVVWNKLYKRKLFEDVKFEEGMLYEDVEIIHRIFWNAECVAVTETKLSFYRSKREQSITHSGNKYYRDQIKAMQRRCDFFKGKDKELYEQSLYMLCNDYARCRIYNKDKAVDGIIAQEHKSLQKMVRKSGLNIIKKNIAILSMRSPKTWFFLWRIRRVLRIIQEWKFDSLKVLKKEYKQNKGL